MSTTSYSSAHLDGVRASRWLQRSLIHQMANIGIEVERVMEARRRGNLRDSECALWRMLDLFTVTVEDPKNRKHCRRKEILRVREALLDYFMGDNEYQSTDQLWHDYFYTYCYIAAQERQQRTKI